MRSTIQYIAGRLINQKFKPYSSQIPTWISQKLCLTNLGLHAQQEMFVFNAIHPQKLMDGRVRTEAHAPFIKTWQPSSGLVAQVTNEDQRPCWGMKRVGAVEEVPAWPKRTETTYNWSICAPLAVYAQISENASELFCLEQWIARRIALCTLSWVQ